MSNNTVEAVVARFLNNKHRDEFMLANPWLDLTTATIVYFRRHTSHKTWYATYKDIDHKRGIAEWDRYFKAWQKTDLLHWWQIPVSKAQVAKIKPETHFKYAALIAELSDQYLDIP
jgi:hypothetical protein